MRIPVKWGAIVAMMVMAACSKSGGNDDGKGTQPSAPEVGQSGANTLPEETASPVPVSEAEKAVAMTGSACAPACEAFSADGKAGWKLNDSVADARKAGRFDEAVCLGQPLASDADKKLAAAATYELSAAWQGLGCPAQSVAAIQQSIGLRTPGSKGWTLACQQCRSVEASSCALCDGKTDGLPKSADGPAKADCEGQCQRRWETCVDDCNREMEADEVDADTARSCRHGCADTGEACKKKCG